MDWKLFGNIDLPFYDVLRFLFLFDTAHPTGPDRLKIAVQRNARRLISRYANALRFERQELASLPPLSNWHYRQPLLEGKAFGLGALEDYFRRPAEWERTLLA